MPHEEVPAHIAGAKIGVNIFPNEQFHASAQPLKILEYTALEKPVVATNLQGTIEIVQHKSQGFLYNCGACSEWPNYIIQLLGDEELRK